jgi:carboxylesterase type B
MICPSSKGLFSKAIAESNPWSLPLKTFSEAKELAKLLREYLKCDENDISCMRNKSASEIVAGQDAVQNHFSIFTPLSLFMVFLFIFIWDDLTNFFGTKALDTDSGNRIYAIPIC